MSDVAAGGGRSVGSRGGMIIVIGLAFIGFFLLCLMTQVETNQAFINHAAAVDTFRPNWGVFLQIPGLFLGWYGADMTRAIEFGWGVELIYLALTFVGYELIHNAVHQSGRVIGIIFEVIAFAVVCLNWYTDFNYGTLGSGDWGHFWFACMTSIVVGYFGQIGFFLIRMGWNKA